MIKANEIRVGNWLVFDNKIVEPKFNQVNAWFFRQLVNDIEDINPTLNGFYSGIPLTPDILEKCGFRHRLGNTDTIHEYFIGTNPVTNDWLFDLCYIDSIGHRKFFYRNGHHTVTYVHELQNLYFALTGLELSINL